MSVFDLSRWQPADRIEEMVEGGKCDGVILKLGERNVETGEIELDPMFITHINEAVRFGLPYGIYIMGRAIMRRKHWKKPNGLMTVWQNS